MNIARRTLLGWMTGVALAGRCPATERGWPVSVTQPELRLTPDGLSDGGSVFQSPHFEYWVETDISPALMNEFARCAEGTRRLWRALPLDLPPDPPNPAKAQVRIWRNEASYQAAGGPPRTAGYFRHARDGGGLMMVNAESLGLDSFMGRLSRDGTYRPSVLIHELSHLATTVWSPYLPMWLREGLAEYGALLPFAHGTFRLDAASLRGAVKKRADFYRTLPDGGWDSPRPTGGLASSRPLAPWILPLVDLLNEEKVRAGMASLDWRVPHRIYFTALLLSFFLIHLDPPAAPGQCKPMLEFLSGVTTCIRYFRREDGTSLPPEWPAEVRPHGRGGDVFRILEPRLWKSRTPVQLEKEMRAAFAAIGVPLS